MANREGLLWSKDTTASATAVLDSYGESMGELGRLIQPVAQRVQALTAAGEKIKAARAWAQDTLHHLDTTRLVEPTVQVPAPGPPSPLPFPPLPASLQMPNILHSHIRRSNGA